MTDTSASMPTRKQRWMVYGLNLTVFVLAVLAIAVFLNWIMVRKINRYSWLRFDLTATGQYSLSPQTRRILSDLPSPVNIVALFSSGSALDPGTAHQQQQVRDLLEEYQRRSAGKIRFSSFDPTLDLAKYEQFAQQLRQRYDADLQPVQQALKDALAELEHVHTFFQQQQQTLQANLPRFNQAPQLVRRYLETVANNLAVLPLQLKLESLPDRIRQLTETALPDYAAARTLATGPLDLISNQLFKPVVKDLKTLSDDQALPDGLKDFLLSQRQAYQEQLDRLTKVLDKLNAIEPTDYDQARDRLMTDNALVVMTDDRLSVLAMDDVYTVSAPKPGQATPDLRFIGEEKITGTLVALSTEHKPMVVLVNPDSQPAVGPGGSYSHVAEVLENMNFDVREWNPAGRSTPYGNMPPEPKPEPAEGQVQILVALPSLSQPGRMPFNPAEPQVIEAIKKHIEEGKPALLFVGPSPMARFGQPDQRAQMLKDLGLTVRADRMIMEPVPMRNGDIRANPFIQVHRWPDDHPIAKAVQGLPAILVRAVALEPDDELPQGLSISPLGTTDAKTWLESDYDNNDCQQDPDEPTGPFNFAVAINKKDQRLVVIGSSLWAHNTVTTYQPVQRSDGTIAFIQFPGNAELFVNSVYWLAGLDELIATSSRTQDVRRFQPLTEANVLAVRLVVLLGLPVGCLLAGGTVWLIRRK